MTQKVQDNGLVRWRIAWWLAFLLICILGVCAKLVQDAVLTQAIRKYEKQYQALDQAQAAAIHQTSQTLNQLRRELDTHEYLQIPAPSRAKLEALLGKESLKEATVEEARTVLTYTEPLTGRTCELCMIDGQLAQIGAMQGYPAPLPTPTPTRTFWAIEYTRRFIRRWGPMAWLFLLPIASYCIWRAKGRATLAAQCAVDSLLMLALVVVLASVLRHSIFILAGKLSSSWQPSVTGVQVAMVCVSVGLLVWGARRARTIRPGLCRVCQYNLRGNVSGICPECGTAIEARQQVEDVAQ